MSYCRWSSDDWRSDIYCYESSRGYEIHVASRRRVLAEPLPPMPAADDIEALVRRYVDVMRSGETAALVDIGLPHDGESYTFDYPREAADQLEYLRSVGYHVPQCAIDALREEAAEPAA